MSLASSDLKITTGVYMNRDWVATYSRLSSFHFWLRIEHSIRNEMSTRNHVNEDPVSVKNEMYDRRTEPSHACAFFFHAFTAWFQSSNSIWLLNRNWYHVSFRIDTQSRFMETSWFSRFLGNVSIQSLMEDKLGDELIQCTLHMLARKKGVLFSIPKVSMIIS